MKLPVVGSKWSGSDGKEFMVIELVEVDNQQWIYYRENTKSNIEPKLYSCFVESFQQRFRELP